MNFFSSSNLMYPGQLRLILVLVSLITQVSLLLSPAFGIISASISSLRDAIFSFSLIGQFQITLCIAHALYQRAKVVSSPEGVRVRTYALLVLITSLLVVLATFVVFLLSESGSNYQLAGWLHLGWAWASALLAPITVSLIFSLIWLIQSTILSINIRPMSVQLIFYLLSQWLFSASLLSSFSVQSGSSKLAVDWLSALFLLLSTSLLLISFSPDKRSMAEPVSACLRRVGLLPRNPEKRGGQTTCQRNQSEAWLIADNRTSLAEFRYIPVVHNIHSQR